MWQSGILQLSTAIVVTEAHTVQSLYGPKHCKAEAKSNQPWLTRQGLTQSSCTLRQDLFTVMLFQHSRSDPSIYGAKYDDYTIQLQVETAEGILFIDLLKRKSFQLQWAALHKLIG